MPNNPLIEATPILTTDMIAAMAKEIKHALVLGKSIEDGVRMGYEPMMHAARKMLVKIPRDDPSCMGAFMRARPK